MTLEDLRRMLADCAGEGDTVGIQDDISDTPFTDLGYDSLALLETIARIERDFGVALPEDLVATLDTPRSLLAEVQKASVPVD
ncbi:acyl carrier protein [Streptomyces sp. NPDC050997]|uniref:acyl carrier protein n=1 Tax=Streptomyces sp. NPDC050997 TaxID=3155519 RepID=UPI00341654F8